MPRWGEVKVDERVQWLERETDELRQPIAGHRVYALLQSLPQVRTFMAHHVFAVWDFMSLLKCRLTCTTLPWEPRGSADRALRARLALWDATAETMAAATRTAITP